MHSNKKRKLDEAHAITNEHNDESNESDEIIILNGTGRITSSGTTVHGHNAEFMNQLKVGDAILITHPTT